MRVLPLLIGSYLYHTVACVQMCMQQLGPGILGPCTRNYHLQDEEHDHVIDTDRPCLAQHTSGSIYPPNEISILEVTTVQHLKHIYPHSA